MNTNSSQFDSGVPDHKMTWTHDKMHLAESVDESRMKFQRNSVGSTASKVEKFDLFKKLHQLYNELSRDEPSQSNHVSVPITQIIISASSCVNKSERYFLLVLRYHERYDIKFLSHLLFRKF